MEFTHKDYGEWAILEGVDPYGPHEPADPTPATNAQYTALQHLKAVTDRIPTERLALRHLPHTYAANDVDLIAAAKPLCSDVSTTAVLAFIEVVESALTCTQGLCTEIDMNTEHLDAGWYWCYRNQAITHLGEDAVTALERLGKNLAADAGHGSGYWMYAQYFTAALIGAAGGSALPDTLRRTLTSIWRGAVREVALLHLRAARSRREGAAQNHPIPDFDWGQIA